MSSNTCTAVPCAKSWSQIIGRKQVYCNPFRFLLGSGNRLLLTWSRISHLPMGIQLLPFLSIVWQKWFISAHVPKRSQQTSMPSFSWITFFDYMARLQSLYQITIQGSPVISGNSFSRFSEWICDWALRSILKRMVRARLLYVCSRTSCGHRSKSILTLGVNTSVWLNLLQIM